MDDVTTTHPTRRLTLAEIRERLETSKGQAFWRSLDEIAETDEFQEFMRKEWPRQAAPLENSLDRRGFLKLLGASMALAGLTACARPVLPGEKIVPYVRAPEEIVPGRPLFFATAITTGGYAEGLLAESHQGRPTKLEGNPDHPASLGATTATTQAAVLTLYDPDRSQEVLQGGRPSTWEAFTEALAAALDGLSGGAGLYLLTENVTSPTMARQIGELLQANPQASWHQYDPTHRDETYAGTQLAFGQPVAPVYDFSQADVILSLDADFTHSGPGRLRYARDFARRRRVREASDDMNRLYQVESSPSPTGSIADHRLPLAPAAVAALAAWVAGELGVEAPEAALPGGVEAAWAEALVADLQDAGANAVVVVGEEQPAAVQALAHAMNAALGAVGTTVRYVEPVEARVESHGASLAGLVEALDAGDVELLVVIGGNPVYTAPADLGFADALANAGTVVHMGLYVDETAARSAWHLPQTHFLEDWSDARAFDGTATIVQPLIAPFYNGVSEHRLLAALAGDTESSAYELVRDTWTGRVEGDVDSFWRQSVYRGVVDGTESPTVEVSPALGDLALPEGGGDLTVLFRPDPSIGDGRWANNGWLQELPNPFTKLTWDNAALIAPADAEALGVDSGDLVTLSTDAGQVTLPVWVLPGQARGAVTVHLGYGHTAFGRVADGLGFDVTPIRPAASPWQAAAEIAPAGGSYKLVTTQVHHSLEGTGERRHIIRSGTLAEFREHPEHPEFAHPVEHHESDLYPEYEYDSYAWGMVIDMTVCTGCNACVTACQAENNVPVVGKEQVAIGREMHWIRVDNYYRGDLDNPEYFHQPMACQHCEKAPCEPVCPVGATVHDHEGLNVMVYNRCVGTRYCSNNCPYKVRRFNFLQYAQLASNANELALVNNPDVTVRSRGVMEKCTYCQQRIAAARIQANNQDRSIVDGEVVTACQAACPTEAIVFGDLNDADSLVSSVKRSPLNYKLLEELNTVPRTTYMARVGNPNPALAGEEGV